MRMIATASLMALVATPGEAARFGINCRGKQTYTSRDKHGPMRRPNTSDSFDGFIIDTGARTVEALTGTYPVVKFDNLCFRPSQPCAVSFTRNRITVDTGRVRTDFVVDGESFTYDRRTGRVRLIRLTEWDDGSALRIDKVYRCKPTPIAELPDANAVPMPPDE